MKPQMWFHRELLVLGGIYYTEGPSQVSPSFPFDVNLIYKMYFNIIQAM